MIVKNDRMTNARDYFKNVQYDKHLRHIVRGILLEPEAPMGIRLVEDIFKAYLISSGHDILLKDD